MGLFEDDQDLTKEFSKHFIASRAIGCTELSGYFLLFRARILQERLHKVTIDNSIDKTLLVPELCRGRIRCFDPSILASLLLHQVHIQRLIHLKL